MNSDYITTYIIIMLENLQHVPFINWHTNEQNMMILGPRFNWAWGPLFCDIQITWLVEKLEIVQAHFTIEIMDM